MSERFAQYIDQMIQASGMASGCVETLERLQQFLEPMLFLSGLELASTFEHFYRCDHTCAALRCASRCASLTITASRSVQVLPGRPAAGSGERVAGACRGGADRQLLPEPLPAADAEEPERVVRAAAGVPPVPAAAAGPQPAGARPGHMSALPPSTHHCLQGLILCPCFCR